MDTKSAETKPAMTETEVMVKTGVQLATSQQEHRRLDKHGVPYLLLNQGFAVERCETMLARPTARRGTVKVNNVASFIELVKREAIEDTVIFACFPADPKVPGNITAIIDYHGVSGPSWAEYRIRLDLMHTPEWSEWRKILGQPVGQEALAYFLEERYQDVHSVDGVTGLTMLEVAKSLQAKKGCNFSNQIRLDNGDVCLSYEETTTARAGQKGELEIPQRFTLWLPIFEGFDPVAITVLFRFRITQGALAFICQPVNLDRLMAATKEAIVAEIVEHTNRPCYMGDAESVPKR